MDSIKRRIVNRLDKPHFISIAADSPRFVVGAYVRQWNGGGNVLVIKPDFISLELGKMMNKLTGVQQVVHHGKQVKVVHTRLMVPWMNTNIVLHGDTENAVVRVGFSARGRIEKTLIEAGYELEIQNSLFSLAGNELRRGKR